MKIQIFLFIAILLVCFNCSKNELSPIANFKANKNILYVNDTIHFMDSSLNKPLYYSWQFEGGTPSSSTEMNPDIVYKTPGTYSVLLRVSNNEGIDSIIKNNFIIAKDRFSPVANFGANRNFIFAGDTVMYADSSLNKPLKYTWLFEGGTPASSTKKNPQVIYKTSGTYSVSLMVSNNDGIDKIIKDKHIYVKDMIVGSIDSSIIYTDLIPDRSFYSYLDYDKDGINELKVYSTKSVFCGLNATEYYYWVEAIFPYIQILAVSGSPKVLNLNDTLSNQTGWTSNSLLLHSTGYNCMGKSYPGRGNWGYKDKKYMGIKIKDKLGWIQLSSIAGFIIHDYGFSK